MYCDEVCGNCIYCKKDWQLDDYTCENEHSDFYLCYTDYNDYCENFEPKK